MLEQFFPSNCVCRLKMTPGKHTSLVSLYPSFQLQEHLPIQWYEHPTISILKTLPYPSSETCLDKKCASNPQETTFKISMCHYLFFFTIFIMVSSAMHKEDMMTEEQLKVTGITDVNPFANVIFV